MSIKVYFFCYPLGTPDKSGYEHVAIGLAEGLKELGVTLHCNVDLWQQSIDENNFLIKKTNDPKAYKECDIVLFTSSFFLYQRLDLLPTDLFNKKRKYKLVFLDNADGLITPGFDKNIYENVDIILKSHYNKRYSYPENFRPWQFGFTKRILETVQPLPYGQREKEILINFRLTHKLRDMAKTEILPMTFNKFSPNYTEDSFEDVENNSALEQLYWRQTGRRHYPAYYKRLSQSMACACFGGFLQENMETETFNFKHKLLYQVNKVFPIVKYDRLYQFDSFRFWEAMVAGCCIFHVDLKKFGAVFPETPESGKHYIGVDVNNPEATKKIMKHGYHYFEDAAMNGKEWAIQKFSTIKVGERFLELV